jgi:acetolactate synthase I/II/III large subunit
MARELVTRTGGRILVDQLVVHGAELVFGVPGESYLEILDALHDTPTLQYVTCRHEAGAANMAEAYGKLTGRPGVCMVTRGPGATHASVGVHTANQDGTPLLLLVGQVPREQIGREAFQELDYRAVFGSMAKWVAQIDDPSRIPELVARAYRTATSGRPGPVVLALPEDMLTELTGVPDATAYVPAQPEPSVPDVEQARAILDGAKRPLVIVGGQPWTTDAHAALASWCEASGVPVAAAWRCQDYVDNVSPCYAGHLGLAAQATLTERFMTADALLVIGTRLGDIETQGFTTLAPPGDGRAIVHVHPAPEELGRVYSPTLGIVASGPSFATALAQTPPLDATGRRVAMDEAHAQFLDNLNGRELPGAVDPTAVMGLLAAQLDDDAILTSGAGNFTVWAHRFWTFRHYRTQLAPLSGAMAYGLPAAIAAQLVHPERQVVCLAGDGDFLMSSPELATAVQYELPIVIVIFDNGMYGTIRMHQERLYPGRVSGTELRNPDFAELAMAFGARGERAETTAEAGAAIGRALASEIPSVVHLVLDPEALTPRATLSEIRTAGQADRAGKR